MTTRVHCVECGNDFSIKASGEPLFCCFCQEELIFDLDLQDDEEEEIEPDDE